MFEPPDYKDVLFRENDSHFDQRAQDLFSRAVFEGDKAAYSDLVDYMQEEYGIDFEEVFEWQDFREWYDGVS